MKIENKPAERLLTQKANYYEALLQKIEPYVGTLEEFTQLIDNAPAYARDSIYAKYPDAEKLGLPLYKLVELYSIPLAQMQTLAAEAGASEFLHLVEYENGLQLNPDRLEEYIKTNATIQLSPAQEVAYKAAERASKALNDASRKLAQMGVKVPLNNVVNCNYAGLWQPNEAAILQTISKR